MRDSIQETGAGLSNVDTSGSPVKATLKWFNKAKGFGFVIPDDRSVFSDKTKDAFIHITTLFEAKCEHLGENATFICIIDEGPKGLIVREITDILSQGDPENGTDLLNSSVSFENNKNSKFESGELYELKGEVKWYRPEKGFGFIIPEDGEKDVFIHRKCLEELGIKHLDAGQNIVMMVRAAPKGREVVSFKFNDKKYLY